MFRLTAHFALVCLLAFLAACSSKPKKMESLSDGYEPIRIARAETPADNEVIKPEFVTEIRKSSGVVTGLETYTAKRGQQQVLADALVTEFRKMSGKVPGLVSFNIHKSNAKSGRIYNYMQFESAETLSAFQASQIYKAHLTAIEPFVSSAELERLDVIYILQ